jgi:uncharacterized protein HemX
MNRLLLSVVVALVLALGLSGYGLYYQTQRVAVLADQNKSLVAAAKQAAEREKSTRKVLVARQAKIASQARKLAQSQQALSEALQRNKSWSDTDVPDDVQKALQGRSSGLDSAPASLLNPD